MQIRTAVAVTCSVPTEIASTLLQKCFQIALQRFVAVNWKSFSVPGFLIQGIFLESLESEWISAAILRKDLEATNGSVRETFAHGSGSSRLLQPLKSLYKVAIVHKQLMAQVCVCVCMGGRSQGEHCSECPE